MFRTSLIFLFVVLFVAKATIDNNVDEGFTAGRATTLEERERVMALRTKDEDNRNLYALAFLLFRRIVKDTRAPNFISYADAENGPIFDYAVGCSNSSGTGGNPSDVVHCFPKTAPSFLRIGGVRFWMVDDFPPLPTDPLTLKIWNTDLTQTLYEQEIPDLVGGENVINFNVAYFHLPTESKVCVGLGGTVETSGFRVVAEFRNATFAMNSYVKGGVCGFDSFTPLSTAFAGTESEDATIAMALTLGQQ
mmetsp:Transcript_35805/g.55092  ORF Transcript_35805/g.55092 Transcript_35805/m.55092 type:complete len:249 (+) Transcript_35805:70-816(+)